MAAIFGHDFRQVRSQSGNRNKYWQGGAQSTCDNQLRWRHGRIHGTQPTAKAAPDLCCVIDGQVLQQPLSDTAKLDIDVVGVQLSANGGPVRIGGPMQILITPTAVQRRHTKHPEVIRDLEITKVPF